MKKILAAVAVSTVLAGPVAAQDGLNMGALAANGPLIAAGITMLVIVGAAANADSSSVPTTRLIVR